MLLFVPTAVSEIVGLGEGIASSEGHSLRLPGFVLEENSQSRRFCEGHLRIQERTRKDDGNLGVAQITEIKKAPYLSAALIVERNQFEDIREILVRSVGDIQVHLEDASHITASELARSKTVVTLVSASVSGLHAAPKRGTRG